MDFELSKEQQLIKQLAKDFADKVIAPIADEIEATHEMPKSVYEAAGELGLMSIPFAEEVGGAEGGYDGYVLALEQISQASSSVAMAIMAHTLGMSVIDTFGNDEQRAKYLPGGSSGEHIFSLAFTEPGTGSDPKQITTVGERSGDDWVLNGTKRFITNSAYPGPCVVVGWEKESHQMTSWIVDKDAEGYSTSAPWEKIAMNGGQLCDVYLKDCKVPAANLMGEVGDGFYHLEAGIGYGKLGIASFCLGLAQSGFDAGLEYASTKMHRDRAIGEKFQAVKLMIAEMYNKLMAARLTLYRAADRANRTSKKDQAAFAMDCAAAKDFVAEMSRDIVNICMDIHGSYGLMKDYDVERMYREAVMMPQIEGVPHIQKIIVANHILAGR